MAGEIRGSLQLQIDKTNFQFQRSVSLNFDQTGDGGGNPGTLTIPTSDTAVTLTGITTPGWAIFRNLDATNYVDFGPDSGGAIVPFGRMEAGEPACFRLQPSGLTLRMQANTASCRVEIEVMED